MFSLYFLRLCHAVFILSGTNISMCSIIQEFPYSLNGKTNKIKTRHEDLLSFHTHMHDSDDYYCGKTKFHRLINNKFKICTEMRRIIFIFFYYHQFHHELCLFDFEYGTGMLSYTDRSVLCRFCSLMISNFRRSHRLHG